MQDIIHIEYEVPKMQSVAAVLGEVETFFSPKRDMAFPVLST